MRVIGYTFEADCHCVRCTLARYQEKGFDILRGPTGTDENGLPYAAQDYEGNTVHPIFSTDEGQECCGDCGEEIQ